jgi:hypothetical protein
MLGLEFDAVNDRINERILVSGDAVEVPEAVRDFSQDLAMLGFGPH